MTLHAYTGTKGIPGGRREAQKVVHAEAYFLWNTSFAWVILLLGGKLAGLTTPKGALLLAGSLMGGVSALLVLLFPALQMPVLFLWPLAVFLCHREEGGAACLRALVGTICAAFLLGGGATLLTRLGQSPAVSMSLSALTALLLWTLAMLLPSALCEVKQLELCYNGQSVILPAMLDSGNLLKDPFTGLPVMVVSLRALAPLFPDDPDLCGLEDLPMGFRLLSVRTASGRTLLPLFRPDACRVYVNGHMREARAMVAVSAEYGGVQALVPLAAVPGPSAAQVNSPAREAVV